MFDFCLAHIALSWNDLMSCQHTSLIFVENANEAESSVILHQKTLSTLLQNSSFFKMEQVESDTSENLGWPRSDMYQSTN